MYYLDNQNMKSCYNRYNLDTATVPHLMTQPRSLNPTQPRLKSDDYEAVDERWRVVVCPGTYEPPSSPSPVPNQLGTLITGPHWQGRSNEVRLREEIACRSAAFQLWKRRVDPCGDGAEGSMMTGMVKMA